MSIRLGFAGVLVALAWSLLPGVALANSGIAFNLRMNGDCVRGTAPAGGSLHVVWKRPSGKTLGDETTAPFDGGQWQTCTGSRLKAGDRVVVTLDGARRRFVVPNLTIALDRVADIVSGVAPAGATVHVDDPFSVDVVAGSDRTWSYHRDGTDFFGSVFGSAHWSNANGDRVDFWAFTPQIFLRIGDATVHVFAHPDTTATITLTRQTTTGQRVATLHETFNWTGEVWDTFVDQGGRAMKVKAGDHISAPQIASDMDWVVPEINGTGHAATNVVTGHCSDAGTSLGLYNAAVFAGTSDQARGYASGSLDGQGNFSIDFDDPQASTGDPNAKPADVQSGDYVGVECEQTTGDYAIAHFRVY